MKKRRVGKRKKMRREQLLAQEYVNEWVYGGNNPFNSDTSNDFGLSANPSMLSKTVVEFHSHSNRSDGFLSPSKLVERAHAYGVKVLALTDHDTMSGVLEAVVAARKLGIKIIPGVEISTLFPPREEYRSEESVHILAYYSSFGPTQFHEIERLLSKIRDGRYHRAESIISKLNDLKLRLKWDHVARIAGEGVAPGRLHIARAMVEAGYVENVQQAFTRYLYDGGPAYSTGSEPSSEETVEVIRKTGGVAVLAHPWVLKNPVTIIKSLKEVGLHGVEAYRNDGKIEVLCDIADSCELLKIGGSDYHGKQVRGESELGSASIPLLSFRDFLKVARPIWARSMLDIFKRFAEEPCDANIKDITRFGNAGSKNHLLYCLSCWSAESELQKQEVEDLRLKLLDVF